MFYPGSFEESALKGRLEPVATVAGFTAELGACGAFCPPHRRLPVTVFFYAPGGTNAPYMVRTRYLLYMYYCLVLETICDKIIYLQESLVVHCWT